MLLFFIPRPGGSILFWRCQAWNAAQQVQDFFRSKIVTDATTTTTAAATVFRPIDLLHKMFYSLKQGKQILAFLSSSKKLKFFFTTKIVSFLIHKWSQIKFLFKQNWYSWFCFFSTETFSTENKSKSQEWTKPMKISKRVKLINFFLFGN